MPEKVERSVPRVEYERRQARHRATVEQQTARELRMGNARMVAFLAAVVLVWLAFAARAISPVWLTLPVALFVVLGLWHERVRRIRTRAERRAAFSARGLARLDGTWAGHGPTGSRFSSEEHPYSTDLDLFGEASLFQYLSTARTERGEATLASWLSTRADPGTIRKRQGAVATLAPMLDFREDLAVLGTDIGPHEEDLGLARWAERRAEGYSHLFRLIAFAMGLVTTASLLGWLFFGLPGWAPGVAVTIQMALAARYRGTVRELIRDVEGPARSLGVLLALLARFERETFTDPLLAELHAAVVDGGVAPSRAIARLMRHVAWLESRRNALFIPVASALFLATQLALAIESWRRRHGDAVARWLDAIGQLEALCALAGRAFDHPDDVFPKLTEGTTHFESTGLGHPLLPPQACVRNDVALGDATPLWVLSGSNMSGKSTLLRTIGVNAVLAQAGAGVMARSLSMSPLTVAASIRVRDSLQDGRSRFYAEILQLQSMISLAAQGPTLCLIDELLHGTNSHDRRIGAGAIVRGILQRGAIGVVTTHDLALASLEGVPEGRIRNLHLRDHIEAGRMVFDYRLHEGVVRHSNALALMRQVGLDVEAAVPEPTPEPPPDR
jgi:hypothetical protein